eukprot:CAMPEP_0180507462 /NCGR_PEP_ID=MMETSP1036_2-20121128/48617_1 /TAXON_ID=632150 /ORGANISM="Azadinium spinosum, Strain 3D9" /LENGTH=43 /DNA_ID= /DNA_START= /DNA_END= /DNA_ORIENTATION=
MATPAQGSTRRANANKSVDFPEPVLPTMPQRSPDCTSIDTSSR